MYKPHRLVTAIRERYDREVKPMIERGEYELAGLQMGSDNLALREYRQEIVDSTHSGINFIAGAILLAEKLEIKDKSRIEAAQRLFESYAAQTSVPREEFSPH